MFNHSLEFSESIQLKVLGDHILKPENFRLEEFSVLESKKLFAYERVQKEYRRAELKTHSKTKRRKMEKQMTRMVDGGVTQVQTKE